MVHALTLLAALSAAGASVTASPLGPPKPPKQFVSGNDVNPFVGRKLFANPKWATKLEATYNSFNSKGDRTNANIVRKVQKTGTFVWVTSRSGLSEIDDAIRAARTEQQRTGQKQVVGLVLYNLPDRDCSAGESAGELSSKNDGLRIYKEEFVKPYARKLKDAKDLTFAVVLEPDSLGNAVTNMGVEFCKQAVPVYREGIAFAIKELQLENVGLYIDAAHGGWLGWADNLPLAAKEFATVLSLANANKAPNARNATIRGFSTNVSNYNPYLVTNETRPAYTEWSPSYDESHYASSLSPYLTELGLPAHFIIDQGRVALPGAREEWGEWCNVEPAGFGHTPTADQGVLKNENVDAIVWVKPGGESDGQCGLAGAPRAGAWFGGYVEMLVKNADASVKA
ncbi:1, 4-beta cellobiohydrolase [Sordaria brevicollis]|uniref:Glucanase n=1 Tax=Sordaria brevicollis TaxID=83679 RepID=A0AAE0U2J6_SORBR|nr:1, 4-beta cellobiohydrolase [Sordaria brevicollis]